MGINFSGNMKYRFVCFAALCLFVFAACEGTDPVPPDDPVVEEPVPEIMADSVLASFPVGGGEFSFSYYIKDACEGGSLSAWSDASWMSSFTVSADMISFKVAENLSGEERSSEIKMAYLYNGKKTEASVAVSQLAIDVVPGDEAFDIKIEELSQVYARVRVIPADADLAYSSMFVEKSFYDELGSSDEALFDYLVEMYEGYALDAGMPLEDYLASQNGLRKGEGVVELSGMKTDSEYYAFAVGMSYDGEQTTGLYKVLFKTLSLELIDMSFDMDVRVDGTAAYVTIEPDVQYQRYVFDAVNSSTIAVEDILSVYQDYISSVIKDYVNFGMSVEQAVMQISSVGTVTDYRFDLDEYTSYYLFAIAIDKEGVLISRPGVTEFTTEGVKQSDNEITITVSNIKERSADYELVATNEDNYVFVWREASVYAGMSDEQIINDIISQDEVMRTSQYSGDKSGTFSGLKPGTDYVAYAFGYYGGFANTGLFKTSFTTQAQMLSDVTFWLEHEKYFLGDEVKEIYPDLYPYMDGKAVLPVTAMTEGDAGGYFYHVFAGDITDPSSSNYATDDYLYEALTNQGYTAPATLLYLDFGQTFTLVGFASDHDGHYGPVYREVIFLTEDGVSPIDEFRLP